MKIKRSASFSLFAYGKDKDKYQIRFRVSFNSQRIDLATGCQGSSSEWWDEQNELIKSGYAGPKGESNLTINNELRNIKDQMDTVFKFFEINDKIPTPSEVTAKYKERMSGVMPKRPEPEKKKREEKPKGKPFWECFDQFLAEAGEKNAWTPATLEKMFRLIGTGDKAGSGADVIKTGWNENGWPDPELKEHFGAYSDRVELTLRLVAVSGQNEKSKETGKETSKESNAEKVKDLMRSNKRITIKEMAEALKISDSGVEKIIRTLRKEGDIRRKGGRFGGEWEVLK